jgi:hypothetical protein
VNHSPDIVLAASLTKLYVCLYITAHPCIFAIIYTLHKQTTRHHLSNYFAFFRMYLALLDAAFGASLCSADTWTLRKVDQKYLGSFEMWCWTRMEINWTDRVRNEVLHRVKEWNIVHTIKRRKANWIGHILRRNCLLKHVIWRKDRRKDRSDGKTRKKM